MKSFPEHQEILDGTTNILVLPITRTNNKRIDKIIEKPIHIENLIEEVQKLTTGIN